MVIRELFAKLGLQVDDESFEAAEALVHGLKTGLLAAVAGVGAVAAGMLEMGRETAGASIEADHLATRLGVSTDAAQELSFAAKAVGGSAESLQTSMFHMSRTIEAAREGSEEAQKALGGLGVPLQELYKMKPDEQFERLADGLSKTTDQGKKAQKAQALFGRGVVDLLPLISKGGEGIAQFREEAHELGVVLSQETIQESKAWRLEQHELEAQVDALKYKVGGFVIHGLSKLSKWWKDFKKLHGEQILRGIETAVVVLTSATVAYGIANAAAIGTAIAGWVSLGAAAVVAGAETAAAWLAAVAPLAAAGVGLLFAYLAVNDIYHFLKGDKGSLIRDVIDGWTSSVHSWGDALKVALGTLEQIKASFSSEYAKKLHDDERAQDEADAAAVDARTYQRRAQRGALLTPGNVGALSPFIEPTAYFSAPPPVPTAFVGGRNGGWNMGGSTSTNTFNIYQQPGQDPNELAGMVADKIKQHEATSNREAAAAVAQ